MSVADLLVGALGSRLLRVQATLALREPRHQVLVGRGHDRDTGVVYICGELLVVGYSWMVN
jgi:hypothetical protein